MRPKKGYVRNVMEETYLQVSIPTRHIHQVIEMADKTDIRNAIDLLHYSIKGLDKYDWAFK